MSMYLPSIDTAICYTYQVLRALWLVDLESTLRNQVIRTLDYGPLDFVVCFLVRFNIQEI